MNLLKKILSLSFMCVSLSTNVFSQQNHQIWQQADLMGKDWFVQFNKPVPFQSKLILSDTEFTDILIVDDVDNMYSTPYYLSNTKEVVFDHSKVGTTTEGKYIIALINEQGESRTKIYQILYLDEYTLKAQYIFIPYAPGDFIIGQSTPTVWHTADWVEPYDWQSDYDNPYDDGDEHQGGGFHSDD